MLLYIILHSTIYYNIDQHIIIVTLYLIVNYLLVFI